ncbi:hypothetical protein DBR42_02990 [Pelomonas sp. HMWF004]|nr:hypothetical protein DBR42_02990 [Pelomonas sp. HMWF004]
MTEPLRTERTSAREADDLTAPDSAPEAQLLASRPPMVAFVLEFWRTPTALVAGLLMALSVVSTVGVTYLALWSNELLGEVTDSLIARNWQLLLTALLTSIAVGVSSSAIINSNVVLLRLADMRWRTWLSERLVARWTASNVFYEIEREGRLQNADQRIAEDVRMFTEDSVNLLSNMVSVLSQVGSFTYLLWGLSQSLRFDLWGWHYEIAGYMVYIAFAYALGGLLVTHLFGRKLIALNMQKQGVEADYRYLGMKLRENAEQIAFYGGGDRERARLSERFALVRQNFFGVTFRTWKVQVINETYNQVLSPLPTVAALPLYYAGLVTLGGMTRAVQAFTSLVSALSFFQQAYIGFTRWLALTNRLRDLSAALGIAEGRTRGIVVTRSQVPEIVFSRIALRKPDTTLMCTVPPLRLAADERWFISGRSGSGKSTLLRALAGMWPYGEGTVVIPNGARLMFLPQRSYVPDGSLKAGVCYPGEAANFSDAACVEALKQCGLESLADGLHAVDNWQRKLSGGELQRLAMARVILHKPDFVFLDEATSALDPDGERLVYGALLAALPHACVVSVAHRESLHALHSRFLDLGGLDPMVV